LPLKLRQEHGKRRMLLLDERPEASWVLLPILATQVLKGDAATIRRPEPLGQSLKTPLNLYNPHIADSCD
jgi:hypothetical protein